MRINSHNLNERGLKWLHGRAWFKSNNYRERASVEWCIGKAATQCSIGLHLHYGEINDGIMLHSSIPWLFSIYLCIESLMKCGKESEFGAAIHNGGFWMHFGNYVMESSSSDPWWRKTHSWYFPWTLDHHKTEVLDGHHYECVNHRWLPKVVFVETSGRNRKRFMDGFEKQQAAEKSVSKDFTYTYHLKNGELQKRTASVFVNRMTWRARWWPFIPRKKIRTSISVNFDSEVGEKTGSWKGGCLGCGYEMMPFETPEQTLRRMETVRKF